MKSKMKKGKCLLLISCFAMGLTSFAQTKEEITQKFKAEYARMESFLISNKCGKSDCIAMANFRVIRHNIFFNKDIPYGKVNTAGNTLKDWLFEMENFTFYNANVSDDTRRLITYVTEPYLLVLLERSVKEDTTKENVNDSSSSNNSFKDKILREISTQMNLQMKNKYPMYTFDTKKKQIIKFVGVRSGNDLFTPAGLVSLFYPEDCYVPDKSIFQRNDDRDYTGSLLIEIGTDYLNVLRRRPIKSYQTLLYGFDVFTPYFKDSIIFPADTSYNKLDRPHASFQYFGWSKKALSKFNKLRWETTLKFGKIGGKAAENFQNGLHQDVSYSKRPKGWGAQISNGGRLGFSVELKHEYQFYLNDKCSDHEGLTKLNLNIFLEEKFGTYMTNAGLGLQLTNKKFTQNNSNFINHRIRQAVIPLFQHLMWSTSFKTTYVVHNTMLEGFGIVNTTEWRSDRFTPKSVYYLKYDQVRRWTYTFNICLSYTTRYATIFYNWSSFSPETYLSKIGINSPSGNEMNIRNRWQHFAEIGLSFNVR